MRLRFLGFCADSVGGRGRPRGWGEGGGASEVVGAVRPGLVECPAAVLGPTQAGDLVVLQGELVVIGDFFVNGDRLLRVDDDLFLRLDGDDLSVAVWLKDEKRKEKQRETNERQRSETELCPQNGFRR